jgi:cytidylate kinase
VFKELVIRDKLDTERDVSPMKRADDAFDVDTSNITIDECVEKIANEFATRI